MNSRDLLDIFEDIFKDESDVPARDTVVLLRRGLQWSYIWYFHRSLSPGFYVRIYSPDGKMIHHLICFNIAYLSLEGDVSDYISLFFIHELSHWASKSLKCTGWDDILAKML